MFVDIHAHAYRKPVPFVVQFPSVEELLKQTLKQMAFL